MFFIIATQNFCFIELVDDWTQADTTESKVHVANMGPT